MSRNPDITIIGAGPGGYVAALRAAQLGARVVLVEKEYLGGVCLNWGCIPTKALLRTAEAYSQVQKTEGLGVKVENVQLDWPAAVARKRQVVRKLVGGVGGLLKRAGVEVQWGNARLIEPNQIQVENKDGTSRIIKSERIIVATGSSPMALPVPGLSGPGVLDSRSALALERLPSSILIIGGGAVGVEFATMFGLVGVKVTLVEMLPSLVPLLDTDIGKSLADSLVAEGVRVKLSTCVRRCETGSEGCTVTLESENGECHEQVQQVLVAVGHRANVSGIGLEDVGICCERTGIKVDDTMATNVPGVYAIGDVTGRLMLAHVASHQALVAVENALGGSARMDYHAVPKCIFSHPEAASVGLSEKEARLKGFDVMIGRFPLTANGMSLARGEKNGFVKVVAESRLKQILGLHVVGPHASDLILEGGLALTLEATLDEFAATIHPHPTLGEAIAEAALAADHRAIHIAGN